MALSPTPQDFNRRLGQIIATALQDAGISQSTASDLTNIPMTTLKRRLRGSGFPTTELTRIAELLDVTVTSLIAQAEEVAA